MNTFIIPSTLLLTLLMIVGLFFFIRASVKDRTQEIKLVSEQVEASLIVQLQQYFQDRSYKVAKVDPEQNSVTFEGIVRPSIFLAIFLTLLAAVGILCLALVFSLLFPSLSSIFPWLVLLSPAAGFFTGKEQGVKNRCRSRLKLRIANHSCKVKLLLSPIVMNL